MKSASKKNMNICHVMLQGTIATYYIRNMSQALLFTVFHVINGSFIKMLPEMNKQ